MTDPYLDDGDVRILLGDVREALRELPDESVHCVATSPPFFSLRDYGTGRWEGGDPACGHERPSTTMNVGFNERWGQGGGEKRQERKSGGQYAGTCPRCGAVRIDRQIGLESSLPEYVESLVEAFRECRRVLRSDGSLWIEMGDTYSAGVRGSYAGDEARPQTKRSQVQQTKKGGPRDYPFRPVTGVPAKNLYGVPWRVAFALQDDGWILRGAYVWEKPDAMPESVRDRCTTSHSTVFHLSKTGRYFFDLDAIREPFSDYSTGGDGGSYGGRADGVRVWEGGSRGSVRYLRHRGESVATSQLTIDGGEQEPEVRAPDGRKKFEHVIGPNGHENYSHRDGRSRWPSEEGRSPRSVWTIATESSSFGLCKVCRTYWDSGAPARHCGEDVAAHFAVWPHELVGKIIMAATPEAGCCADCGAPRSRVVDRQRTLDGEPIVGGAFAPHANGESKAPGREGVGHWRFATTVEHLGWEPTCGCDAPSVPATVLDPFGGSGTTARQARTLGRHAILVELSPDYAEIAAHRLAQQAIPLVAG